MKKWFQKAMVSAVAVVTLGLISPSHAFWEGVFEGHSSNKTQIENKTAETTLVAYAEQRQIEQIDEQPIDLVEEARQQAYTKFGTKIGPKIQNDFDTMIFPKIQEAIDMTVARLSDEDLSNLAITENPSGNYSEKIFNVYNRNTHEDIIRFHVRTENRPLEGFYYNFHYHTYDDQFATHYDLGDIYWSKNTPPKWLS